jgi:hypothetical protein
MDSPSPSPAVEYPSNLLKDWNITSNQVSDHQLLTG